MRVKPSEIFLSDTRRLWEAAPTREGKKNVIVNACKQFTPEYSYCQMTRLLKLDARKRSLSTDQSVRVAELQSYARKVYDFKTLCEADERTFTVRTAFEALRDSAQIPSHITLKAIQRTAESIGIANEYRSPAKKFQGRDHPLSMIQLDYSKSVYFRFRKDGQIFMTGGEETKKYESRLMIACAVDYMSRACYFQYSIAEGESSSFVRDTMLKVFEEKDAVDVGGEITGHRKILQGIPREISFDRGAGNKAQETTIFLKMLKIKRILGDVEKDISGRRTRRSNKKARGMVEKFIGDFKRGFEGVLNARKKLGSMPPDFTLRELNEWAFAYCEKINSGAHPILKHCTRWQLFEPALLTAKYPPEDALMYGSGWVPRIVQNRMVQGKTKDEWFIAPNYCNDGETLNCMFPGSECYIYHDNELVKLKPQQGSIREMIEEETGSEYYDGFTLEQRLAEEIDIISGGDITMRSLPDDLDDDLREFREKARSTEEIREKAAYFVRVSLLAQKKFANVIHYEDVMTK